MSTYIEGKASLYEIYKPKPSFEFINFLLEIINIDSKGMLNKYLDLGCGTGQFTIPLSKYFKETIGIDFTADMITEAEKVASKGKYCNITWIRDDVNTLAKYNFCYVDLVTIANAFHRMDYANVTPLVLNLLKANGYLVLIKSYGSLFTNDSAWQNALQVVTEEWFNFAKKLTAVKKHESQWCEILKEYPFSNVSSYTFPEERIWKIDDLLGYCYTLSFCNIESHLEMNKFEQKMKDVLLTIHPDNKFIQKHKISIIVAQR